MSLSITNPKWFRNLFAINFSFYQNIYSYIVKDYLFVTFNKRVQQWMILYDVSQARMVAEAITTRLLKVTGILLCPLEDLILI